MTLQPRACVNNRSEIALGLEERRERRSKGEVRGSNRVVIRVPWAAIVTSRIGLQLLTIFSAFIYVYNAIHNYALHTHTHTHCDTHTYSHTHTHAHTHLQTHLHTPTHPHTHNKSMNSTIPTKQKTYWILCKRRRISFPFIFSTLLQYFIPIINQKRHLPSSHAYNYHHENNNGFQFGTHGLFITSNEHKKYIQDLY